MKLLDVLKANASEVFEPESFDEEKKQALVIVPDLSLNGAQTVMFELLGVMNDLGFAVTIVSSEDGKYRDKYLERQVRIAIRPFVSCSEEFKDFMRESFDLVFLNSSSCLPYLFFFINTKVRTLIWLHESEEQIKNVGAMLPPPQLLSPNITILGVTNRVKHGIKNIYDFDIDVLPMPIKEVSDDSDNNSAGDKVCFFIPAAYTYIKGQDILLSAISRLPAEMARACQFVFCGYTLEGQKEYYDKIKQMGEKLDNVTILDSLDREEVYEYYRKCDCVIAPSRIDSTPTSIVEAMMFKKLVIVSANAGISEYLTDCVNGFVFRTEDELFQRLLLVISDVGKLEPVVQKGYKVYKESFSPEFVEEKLAKIIGDCQ